jgi:hypothetical protein
LPAPPRTAVVLGSLEGWDEGLRRAGIDAVSADAGHPDVTVATGRLFRQALATGAESVLLEGRSPRRRLEGSGLHVRRFLPLPDVERAEILLPLDVPAAARYVLERWAPPARRWKRVRNRLLAVLLERRVFPSVRPVLTLGLRQAGPPFLVASARDLGVPEGSDWLLTPAQGDELARGTFHLFPPGEGTPGWILKFARVPGYSEPFERDERGLALARDAGGVAAAHAPELLGRFEVGGLHASVETAAAGQRLIGFLHSGASPAAKRAAIESIASWIVDLARETARSGDALGEERRRLEGLLARWLPFGVPSDLVDRVRGVPAVVQHNDLGSWNVVVGRSGFTAIDWESARERGFPLWDLWYFLADALSHLDGATTQSLREAHFVRLFAGELPSSRLLLGWTRRAAEVSGVPDEALGPLATLCWLHHGESHAARLEAIDRHGVGAGASPPFAERIPRLWLSHPALGTDWPGRGPGRA